MANRRRASVLPLSLLLSQTLMPARHRSIDRVDRESLADVELIVSQDRSTGKARHATVAAEP